MIYNTTPELFDYSLFYSHVLAPDFNFIFLHFFFMKECSRSRCWCPDINHTLFFGGGGLCLFIWFVLGFFEAVVCFMLVWLACVGLCFIMFLVVVFVGLVCF